MKRLFYTTTNQHGFIMPFVLFITVIIFIMISSSILHYERDIEITERHILEIQMETLFQMGRERVTQEISAVSLPQTFIYEFPDGIVRVEAELLEQDMIELMFKIKTKSGNAMYSITDTLSN